MNTAVLFIANEVMAFITILIAFPGAVTPSKLNKELFFIVLLMIPMSMVWPLYLALAPIAFLILWLLSDWTPKDHLAEWPWKQLFAANARNAAQKKAAPKDGQFTPR